ncbi:hypothetical protein GQ457_09G013450 [Hibiscus cannabinus]
MQGLSKTGSDLAEALVLEILSKLPVKSLTRFREFKILPQPPPLVDSTSFDYLAGLGFGYDSQTDDYKVVRFVVNYFEEDSDVFEHNNQVELYSLTSDSWKEISVDPYDSPPFNCYINGVYYWQATGSSGHLVLSFHMVNEKFSTLPLPQTVDGFYSHLLDFNGLLGAIFYPGEGIEKSFDLWVMNESWTKQFSIESVPGVEMLLGFWKKWGIVWLGRTQAKLKDISGCMEQGMGTKNRGQVTLFLLDLEKPKQLKTDAWLLDMLKFFWLSATGHVISFSSFGILRLTCMLALTATTIQTYIKELGTLFMFNEDWDGNTMSPMLSRFDLMLNLEWLEEFPPFKECDFFIFEVVGRISAIQRWYKCLSNDVHSLGYLEELDLLFYNISEPPLRDVYMWFCFQSIAALKYAKGLLP